MEQATVAGVGVLLLISYYVYLYVIKRATAGSTRKPPVATGGWPFMGHLHLLRGSGQLPHEALGALADKYGPLFSIRIGAQPAVVVSSWELAKECFTTLDVIASYRPKFTAITILQYDYASFAFAPYGDFWREMHKITVSELLSTRRSELLRGIRESKVYSSVKKIYRALGEKRSDMLVEMKQLFGETNLNAILRMVARKRYSNGSGGEAEQTRRVQRVLRELFRLMGVLVIGDAIPFLGWVDLGGEVKHMKKIAKELDNIVSEWIEEHRQKRDSGKTHTEQDFIDVLLSVIPGVDVAGYDPDTVIKATCSIIIGAGADTTMVTMTWVLSLLLNNRRVLKKIQDELDEHVGRERLVNETDINKLVYLQAVIKETMRLYPAAPLSGPREFRDDCTLGGYHIQAGTRFILNIWKMHRDPRVWSDPLAFQPKRFLTTHKDMDVKGQHFQLLPFGGGRRSCPGMPFALQMTHMALAAFLQAFEVTTPNNAQVNMTATFGLTAVKTTPLEVLVQLRLPYKLFLTDETN